MPLTAVLLLLATRSLLAPQGQAALTSASAGVERPLVAEKKWAICVGASEYKELAPLKYSDDDARLFGRALIDGYGFDASTVSIIADGTEAAGASSSASEKRPTSETILGEVKRLLKDRRLDRGDLFIFYFSGHGVGTASGDFLMPTDVPEREAVQKGVPVKDLIGAFVAAGLKNVLVIADACRSGAQNPFGKELQELGRKSNIAILLGCAPGQRSYEYPRLEHGVFTHFLVRDLNDRSLADENSGALWASAIASKVATQVKEYTEADYGDDAQTPAVWSELSQDVLLAAYPPKGEQTKAWLEGMIQEEGGALGRERYGRYLSTLGRVFSSEGRTPESIQAFKTLDGLGLASWRDLAALAAALDKEGRENEIQSLVARAVREPQPTDLTELVILHGDVQYAGRERYLKAVRAATRPETYGFQGAQILVALLRFRVKESAAGIAEELAPYRPLFPPDSMPARFVGAHIALGQGRFAEAATLAEAAEAMPEAQKESSVPALRQVRYLAAQELKDEAKMDAIALQGEADPEDAFPWTSLRLERLRMRSDPGFLVAVQAAAAKSESDSRFTEILTMLGADAGTVLPDAERLAKAHPYSWQAPMNVWLATSAQRGFAVVPSLPEAGFKYAPNRADFVRVALNTWDGLLEKARRAKRIENLLATLMRGQLAGRYRSFWDDIKEDPRALLGMGRMVLGSGDTVQGAFFGREFLWPFAQKQTYLRRELETLALYLALNGADEATAKEIFGVLEKEGLLSPRAIVRYAMHQALRGDGTEAERAIGLWPLLKEGEPNSFVQGDFLVIRALLAAKRHEPETVKALIAKTTDLDDEGVMLGWFARFEADGREGLSEDLGGYVLDPNTEFADLHVAVVVSAVEAYSSKKSEIERKVLTALSMSLASYPGHPWVQRVGFNGLVGHEHWAGKTEWKGTLSDGVSAETCSVTLGVDAKGKAVGIIGLPEMPGAWTLAGKVDERGNLSAEVSDEQGREILLLVMKLPPTKSAMALADSVPFRVSLLNRPTGAAELLLTPTKATPLASAATGVKALTSPKKRVGKAPKRPPIMGTPKVRSTGGGAGG